ncbi:Na(+)-translocating NADH-quinone reductase subunit C [Thalassotalea crassostreae]|uniref:Na(+)-translocating NADH-quinone reductase subunit C n=1 Tax=Thalassotalea crassostreae TaxID=1763536 RepID=UPI000838D6D4|nr:Na(+)-translocating NADH-quinone reductase subunit C [Thalassotalea crassostreae]
MASKKESFLGTVGFVVAVCLVCAALVSVSAVGLKDRQVANKLLDQQTKILEAAGLLELGEKDGIVATYNQFVTAKMIDLNTGEYIEGNPDMFEERREARDVSKSIKPENDIAGINRRANSAVVYLVRNGAGTIDTIILPIVGSGLWDLMYGFIGLETDANTVKSVIYSDHKETPGLGAEVLNPKWKALWPGKKMFNDEGEIAIRIVKGNAKAGDIHDVDGLSGATLTSVGVEKTIHFWLGEEGYGPYIANIREKGIN